ncbi:zinc finger CCHC domain-containing protein 9-like [Onthophagus taurus]|uniref:zinc finger CCHC domain-containing protein 9-like n=1 Tax=Onthophagus taurus TaxID=166361 RepID=UPI000C20F491|nr:zinc finger CCHC domain-containing protein 9-like [Onthophagus taurus]
MTRFARAKGSKSSNERVPEEATSWQEMQQQLQDKKREIDDEKNRKKAEEKRKENYKNFLDELDDSKEVSWAEIKSEKNETPKKGKKRKLSVSQPQSEEVNGKKTPKKIIKKKYEELTEEEKKKVDKKREKKSKQIEKRNLLKKEKIQNNNNNKKKIPKPKDNKEHKRRKPIEKPQTLHINGTVIKVTKFEGFPVKSDDAERLKKLRKDMISKGIPRSEIEIALKLERRKAEKALAREKKKVCFNCRKSGHVLSECPNLNDDKQDTIASGVCFKCGSTEHTHFECKVVKDDNYKFATCFICNEQGHISRQCPDNNRGLYPKGGACKVCGDVTHLKKDCPKYQAQQEALNVEVDSVNFDNIECLDGEKKKDKINILSNKVIKF